ncbi:MAG: dihydroorotase [Bacteroidales bacterium]|nr:dihydroorotase [Bacteroidales bacterium]
MRKKILLKNGFVVSHDAIQKADILIENQQFVEINNSINYSDATIINLEGLYIFPGLIDTHVHFREPGLTHKADIYSESKASIAGGITTVIDMPNTIPYADSIDIINDKKRIALSKSHVNIGFFIGAQSQNLDTLLSVDPTEVAGIKLFMGSSTGNVMVDDSSYLQKLFENASIPIAVHAEDETIIKNNLEHYKRVYNNDIPFALHTLIRSSEACFKATQKAIMLAQLNNTPLHILHVSTHEELSLFNIQQYPNITAEVCLPHLWFTVDDFASLKGFLKCNPSVKSQTDRELLRQAIQSEKVFSVATDHAPHTREEKLKPYLQCPSGMPFIQHSLQCMIELHKQNYFPLTVIAQKMAYNPALRFNIKNRGQIKEGYYADLVIVNLSKTKKVNKSSILYKCQWSPLQETTFSSIIEYTFVNGKMVFHNGKIISEPQGMLLEYNRFK